MGGKSRTADQKIATLAAAAHGIVERGELLASGVTARQIESRVADGLLIPEFRGAYRVAGCPRTQESDYTAAVKAPGPDALICGRAAAHALGLVKGKVPVADVVCPRALSIEGLRSTQCNNLSRQDADTWKSIPVTSPPRTLVDLAADMGAEALARACHEAGVKYGTTPRKVEEVLKRKPNAKGAAKLRAIIAGDTKVVLSKLERRFLQCLREWSLALPVTNKPAGSRRVDCRWPEHRLTVELNSYWFHKSRLAWERDYQREREARDRGDEFRRFTWADVFETPAHMRRELGKLLDTHGAIPNKPPGGG